MDGVHGETVKKLELGFRLGLLGLLRFDLVLEHACDHQQKQSQFPEVRAHKYERLGGSRLKIFPEGDLGTASTMKTPLWKPAKAIRIGLRCQDATPDVCELTLLVSCDWRPDRGPRKGGNSKDNHSSVVDSSWPSHLGGDPILDLFRKRFRIRDLLCWDDVSPRDLQTTPQGRRWQIVSCKNLRRAPKGRKTQLTSVTSSSLYTPMQAVSAKRVFDSAFASRERFRPVDRLPASLIFGWDMRRASSSAGGTWKPSRSRENARSSVWTDKGT